MLHGCRTGEAKMTQGHRLKVRHIIHTVGPVWNGGKNGEVEKFRACYTNSLRLAAEAGLQSIAFPCISTGVYCFPADQAAQIAVESVLQFLETPTSIRNVIFCCFTAADRDTYERLLRLDGAGQQSPGQVCAADAALGHDRPNLPLNEPSKGGTIMSTFHPPAS